jgi:hypothetical protein
MVRKEEEWTVVSFRLSVEVACPRKRNSGTATSHNIKACMSLGRHHLNSYQICNTVSRTSGTLLLSGMAVVVLLPHLTKIY